MSDQTSAGAEDAYSPIRSIADKCLSDVILKSGNASLIRSALDLGLAGSLRIEQWSEASTVVLTSQYGKFSIAANAPDGVTSALSADGRKLTLSGLGTDLNAFFPYVSFRADDISSLNGRSIIHVSAADCAGSGEGDIRFWSDSFSSSLFSLSSTEYAYVNGFSGLTKKDMADSSSMTDDRVIDAEKSPSSDDDDLLCWAGTASNVLAWTGWGADGLKKPDAPGLEDEIFKLFRTNFTDDGSHVSLGLNWFLNGTFEDPSDSGSEVKNAGSGDYLGMSPEIHGNDLYVRPINTAALLSRLMAGDGVGLSLTDYQSGHAITCWGFSFDSSLDIRDTGFLTGLYITDSDDDKHLEKPSNTLRHIKVAWDEDRKAYRLENYEGE